jgi:hypothetical protein
MIEYFFGNGRVDVMVELLFTMLTAIALLYSVPRLLMSVWVYSSGKEVDRLDDSMFLEDLNFGFGTHPVGAVVDIVILHFAICVVALFWPVILPLSIIFSVAHLLRSNALRLARNVSAYDRERHGF